MRSFCVYRKGPRSRWLCCSHNTPRSRSRLCTHDTHPAASGGQGTDDTADTWPHETGQAGWGLDPPGVNNVMGVGRTNPKECGLPVTSVLGTVSPKFIQTRGSLTHGPWAWMSPQLPDGPHVRGAGQPCTHGPWTDLSTVWLMKLVSSPAAPSSCCRIFSKPCCCSCRHPASGDRRTVRSSRWILCSWRWRCNSNSRYCQRQSRQGHHTCPRSPALHTGPHLGKVPTPCLRWYRPTASLGGGFCISEHGQAFTSPGEPGDK